MGDSPRILVIFSHPSPRLSRVQHRLRDAIRDLPGVEISDLYGLYPDFLINVRAEQAKLQNADLIVFQHPFYWYSCPALLKEWQDEVLAFGFAYGEGGNALRGKDFLQVLSAGGPGDAYQRAGYNRFTMLELLRPFEATAELCGLNYHQPFIVPNARQLTRDEIDVYAQDYRRLLLSYLQNGRPALRPLNSSQHEGNFE